MSEHKTVTIDLEETEKVTLGEHSELESASASGVLSVNNVSERSRIWNVRVLLKEGRIGTTISENDLSAGEVDAGSKWESNYGIDISEPILTLTETFDTCSTEESEESHWAYVHGKENPVRITIVLKNETDGQLDNMVLNKTIPLEFSGVNVESLSSGTAEFDEGTRTVIWKDFLVYPKESATIIISATGNVEDVETKSAGEIIVTYRGESQQRSNLNPDLSALTEFLTGIETAETEPNQWQCTLECSNESDLMVRLDKAEVYYTPEGGGDSQKMIDEAPAFEMAPNDEWTAKFEVSSKTPPKCTQEVVYTPIRVISKRVLGTIEKKSQIIPVSHIDYVKKFDPPDVHSFDKTPVEVTIEVRNIGTAKLNKVIVQDSIPDDIMPPKPEHVTMWIRGVEYSGPSQVTIEPDDQNPEAPHRIIFMVDDLKESVGELEPGESFKINYAIMAWRNRPEKEYPSPIHCKAYAYPKGLPAEAFSADDGHKLGVIYKKRSISVKKGINKGSNSGEYIVVLVIENKGEVTAENVEVTDWIPTGFNYVRTEPEEESPSEQPTSEGTNLVWKYTRMNPGDKRKISVTVQAGEGAGEYERREPQVTSD
ncbi:MAG: DUF11 domain-containing protein [Candidatus Thorarchaeota archaeon]|nr:DUF11 domain-containing protein [Candidatus Thorarchaeota archaeon]